VQACVLPVVILVHLGKGRVKKQNVCMKLCFKLGENAAETFLNADILFENR
jgi:hypothetical protein